MSRSGINVDHALALAAERLLAAGVPEPRVDAEWLLSHVLEWNRVDLVVRRQEELSEKDRERFSRLLCQREARVPLQHLVGSVSFMGHEIRVRSEVLIPRPETERLGELAIERLQSLGGAGSVSTCDLGTGTGCLPIAMASSLPNLKVLGLDISTHALALALENVQQHRLNDRIELLESNHFSAVPKGRRFDLIVSNPPYIPEEEIDQLQPEVALHDPRLALDGGADGLDFYRCLAAQAAEFLTADGRVLMEIGDGQTASIQSLFGEKGWARGAVFQDYSGRDRVLEFCR